jgi:hypothetical protein
MGKPAAIDHDDFDRQNEAAVREGREADRIEPRASAIRYDADRGLVLVELRSGFAFGFPPERVPGLEAGSAKQLANVGFLPAVTACIGTRSRSTCHSPDSWRTP